MGTPARPKTGALPTFAVLGLLGLAACGWGCSGPTVTGPGGNQLESARLDGQGATFVEPVMKVWANEFGDKTNGVVQINYQGTGSGAGVTQMTKKLADFGCSDAPMNRKQLEEALSASGPVVHVPLVIGAVVPVYNLPGVEDQLVFTGPLLADIFTGKVASWNDARIKELNPKANLPELGIQPVYRADPSGTSFIFSDYLSKVSQEFKSSVGASTTPKWPSGVGISQNKSDGVSGHVSRTPGTIGYVELTYALDTNSKYGAVKNRAGKPIAASLESITAAAAATLGTQQTEEPYSLHELTYNLTDADGPESYPIAGMSFAVIYQTQTGAKGKSVVAFLKWCTSAEGQALARKRNFAPLPESLQQKVAGKLDAVEIR